MDFFEHQEAARKKTGRLVALFILAVLCIWATTYLAAAVFLTVVPQGKQALAHGIEARRLIDPVMMAGVGGAVLAVVGIGSLTKIISLRGGGASVAEMLGGRLLDPQSDEPDERQLLNVVEEMALASGVPVPPVYVMDDEPGINAFAAGHRGDDAVIGVTRGTLRLLSRDELQGVIAHEFSHILNGDMRLNLRLIGLLYGILVIALIGQGIVRSAGRTPRSHSRKSKDSGGVIYIIALGLVLMLIGYLGVFFGRLIKAAVSRQREYLADAAAVQFTRYPAGIAGALKKIGGLSAGSHVEHSQAEEVSHMFFGQALNHWLGGLMATHPPLLERVRRLEPGFDGRFPRVEAERDVAARVRHEVSSAAAASGFTSAARPTRQPPSQRQAPAVAQVGQPSEAHLRYVSALLGALPAPVRDAARQPLSAQALLLALLLDSKEDVAQRQIECIATQASAALRQEFARLAPHMPHVDAHARLPLIDVALGALREMSPAQTQAFLDMMQTLIKADDKISLFEWMLRRMVLRHLGAAAARGGGSTSLRTVSGAAAVVLSTLAYSGQRQVEQARRAFAYGLSKLGMDGLPMATPAQCTLQAVDHSLDQLAMLPPLHKRRVLEAAAACVSADGDVGMQEGELLRAVADALDCPMPPLLPGQPLV